MDELAYKVRLSALLDRPCAFEKAILAACVACGRAERIQIAEREAVACQDAASQCRCTELRADLQHGFAFALGRVRDETPLPHAQEMRVQCGGLRGLQFVLNACDEVEDVNALLESAQQQFGELANLPYSEIVHAAAQRYKGRHDKKC